MTRLTLYTPSGVLAKAAPLKLAARRLGELGFEVTVDESALRRHQRFAGDDACRLDALHRVADAAPGVALATRGGYGITRLLDRIEWQRIARSIEQGTRWVGHSDLTALQLATLAHLGRGAGRSWAGPLACEDFGRAEADGGVDEVTRDCFLEAMDGALEAVGFRTEAGFDGLQVRGTLWGGNLTIVNSLLGTPHWPGREVTRGGILFVEDVNEHPYRSSATCCNCTRPACSMPSARSLLGQFTAWKKSPLDRGYSLKTMVAHLRSITRTPIITGLPFGHVPTRVSLPIGARVDLLVDRRDVLIGW